MKHKLVVAMSLLGLISTPAFADTMHKHKHHKKHHHHVAHHDYKAMGGLPVQQAPIAEPAPVATSSMASTILDGMNQNTGMNKPMPEWFNRIGVSGGINLDTGKWGSRSITNAALAGVLPTAAQSTYNGGFAGPKAGYSGENTKRFSINNGYLNVTADVNEWTKALMVLSYTDASFYYDNAYTTPVDTTTADYGSLNQNLTLEQAVVHFGNFDCSPFFAEVGKQFLDFGRYKVHPITASMDQVLTESLHNAVQLGFVSDIGLHGSVYTFQDSTYKVSDTNNRENTMNYGAAVGYAHPDDQFGYDFGVGYMYNILGANQVAALLADKTGFAGYSNRVSAVSAYADLNYEAFNLGARYVTTTSHFSTLDIPRDLNHLTTGAKPWAAGIQAGYDFNAWSKNQNVYLGYQASHDSVYINLPHSRYVVGYSVDVLKNTRLTAEWDHDNAWNAVNGGPASGNSNLISVRAAVKFG